MASLKSLGSRYSKPLDLHLKKGALHEELGISEDKKIPAGRLKAAASQTHNETLRKRAQFAINAKKWNHG